MPAEQLKQKLEELNTEAEQMEGELSESLAPDVEFSVRRLNQLIESINTLMPFFQEPELPMVEGSGKVEMPIEVFDALQMIFGAAEDAGIGSLDDIAEIGDDRALSLIDSKVSGLAQNGEFRSFLRQPPQQMEKKPEAMEEAPEQPEEMEGALDEDEMNKLFMQRI